MAERYVRPPLLAREPVPAWRAAWPFRLAALLALVLLVVGVVLVVRAVTNGVAQDPGLGMGASVGARTTQR